MSARLYGGGGPPGWVPALFILLMLGECTTPIDPGSHLRPAHRTPRRGPRTGSVSERTLKFSVNVHETNAPPGSAAAAAAGVGEAIPTRAKNPRRETSWSVRTISRFEWLTGECRSLQSVLDRVSVPGVAPLISGLPPELSEMVITERNLFVPLEHIYPNVAPVAATIVAALRSGVDDWGRFDFVTERRCLKRIASLSHSLCTDLQMLNGTIFARDVPKHRCVNYGSVGHQFGKACLQPQGPRPRSEFFHLTSLDCGPHRLLVASEVDALAPDGRGVELKVGKLGGACARATCARHRASAPLPCPLPSSLFPSSRSPPPPALLSLCPSAPLRLCASMHAHARLLS
jgi:hypothetical protein